MEEILCRQKNIPRPMTARRLLMGIAGIVLRLAIAQIVVNLAIHASGIGLLNIAFYIYAVLLLVGFMRKTVASTVYLLKENTLVFQKMLGDSTTSLIEIALDRIIAVRRVGRCEDLRLCYKQVTRLGASTRVGLRVRAAFFLSRFSARLARGVAGKCANETAGWAVIFEEDGKPCACVFRPNEAFLAALEAVLPQAFGVDDRLSREPVRTIYGRSLARAFPELYPHVEPLLKEEDVRWAEEELQRQREAREKEKADKAMRAEAARRRRLQKKGKLAPEDEQAGVRIVEPGKKQRAAQKKPKKDRHAQEPTAKVSQQSEEPQVQPEEAPEDGSVRRRRQQKAGEEA